MTDFSSDSLPQEQADRAPQDAVSTQYGTQGAVTQGASDDLIDPWQLREHLIVIGGDYYTPRILCLFPGKGDLNDGRGTWTYITHPGQQLPLLRISADLMQRHGAALGIYINPPLPQPNWWGTLPEHFSAGGYTGQAGKDEQQRRCTAWLDGNPCHPPKTWGIQNDHISHADFVWFEGDSGNPIDEQFALAKRCLGEPTFTVHTGSKSLHCYYRLTAPLQPDEWRQMQVWIIRALSGIAPSAGIDKSLINPARLMRAAGGIHPATGQMCKVRTFSNNRFDPLQLIDQLEHIMPAPVPAQRQAPAKRFTRTSRFSPSRFSRDTTLDDIRRHLDRYPPRTGAKNGTYYNDRDMLWGLICACQEAGHSIDDAINLMDEHSPAWGRGAIEQVANYSFNQVTAGSFWSLAGGIRRVA